MIFNIAVLISVIIVLIYGFIRLSAKQNVDEELGVKPTKMMIKVQQGEKALIFLDLAAKLSINQALFDIQKGGGLQQSSACGEYYGFNRWNSDSGSTCYVDTKTIEENMRKIFRQNMIARMAAYPDADFMMNTNEAAKFVKQPTAGAPGASGTSGIMGVAMGSARYCEGGQELIKDFTYEHPSGWFPPNGVRMFVPKEAHCPGQYPLIIYLHGNGIKSKKAQYYHFGDGQQDVLPMLRDIYSKKRVVPAIFVAPSQTWSDNPDGVKVGSTGALWGNKMDFRKLVELIKQNLPQGITVSSVTFTGTSGGGCGVYNGIYRALQQVPESYMIGAFDTCFNPVFARTFKSNAKTSKVFVLYGTMDMSSRPEFQRILEANTKTECPTETGVEKGGMVNCFTDTAGQYFVGTMKQPWHSNAARAGLEQMLLKFFPASAVSAPGVAGNKIVCGPDTKIAAVGDSITNDGRYASILAKMCPGSKATKNGEVGWQTSAILSKILRPRVLQDKSKGYNVVIIAAGVNDMTQKQPAVESIIKNLQTMYDESHAAGMKVIATTITPFKGYDAKSTKYPDAKWAENKQVALDKVNAWIKSSAKNVDFVVDLYTALEYPPNSDTMNLEYNSNSKGKRSDYLHPTTKGHERMAQEIFRTAFTLPQTQVASTGTPATGTQTPKAPA